jgi:hypothetical protein
MDTKTYFVGITQGEIVCADCAGYQLTASIRNNPKARTFIGAQDTFEILSTEDAQRLIESGFNPCYC